LCFGRAFGLAFAAVGVRRLFGREWMAARAVDLDLALALAVFALGMCASLIRPSLAQAHDRRQNARSFP
jgi:hypothetical protein